MFVSLLSGSDHSSLTSAFGMYYTGRSLSIAETTRVEDLEASADILGRLPQDADLTLRDIYSILICHTIQSTGCLPGASLDEIVQAFMLHVSLLELCPLTERHLPFLPEPSTSESLQEAQDFLRHFSDAARILLVSEILGRKASFVNITRGLTWNLYDLIDGRLFFAVLHRLKEGQPFPKEAIQRANQLISLATSRSTESATNAAILVAETPSPTPRKAATKTFSVLPFSHPIIDKYLHEIDLAEVAEGPDSVTDLIVRDLTHWHNSKSISPKTLPPRKGFYARKRHQKLMADIEAYSRSLTNVGGGNLVRETIVVETSSQKGREKLKSAISRSGIAKENDKGIHSETKKIQQRRQKPGGKEAARLAAQKLQKTKTEKRRVEAAAHWASTVANLENNGSLSHLTRYLKAEAFLGRSSKDDLAALGGEVELYLCHLLGIIWLNKAGPPHQRQDGMYLLATVWKYLQSSIQNPVSLPVKEGVLKISSLLRMPSIPITIEPQDHQNKLSFQLEYEPFERAGGLVNDYRALQLEYGGPYMDRRFGSQPDDRVSFEPDKWQREVLDYIDTKNSSLLVIAPTSAGKTFISFYAMKKVLEESDDAVLVYVAPTKALVNQIAAEINAHYSKSYRGKAGKSVYGIHTRDYRINNPTGCQILVTVPHILQIMLLSAANAVGPNAWSTRIRRIIFDEIHSIGQAEDGVIWEQLLLMAPCPIIALSATVGNPDEFGDWLAKSQMKKGFQLRTVVHGTRYSELRKFIYTWSSGEKIEEGMETRQTVPVPGLDEGDHGESERGGSSSFQFLHPIVALSERNKDALNDISFEARDLFTLWKVMKTLLTDEEIRELCVPDPNSSLPDIITKLNVTHWESRMKNALRRLMNKKPSVFRKVRSHFESVPTHNRGSPNPKADKISSSKSHIYSLPKLAHELNRRGALPALVFNYDRLECEKCAKVILEQLVQAEDKWKASSPEWTHKLREYKAWKETQAKKSGNAKKDVLVRGRNKDGDGEGLSKFDMLREASADHDRWERFDENAPLEAFSFANHSKLQISELEDIIHSMLEEEILEPMGWMELGLRRGIGVHHAGMNRRYRQTVEMLFRRGYLRLVIATGTLAMGINMPCKTVIFSGDSVFLTAQNYRQSSGRAGRRGFDLLGNVVFNGISRQRVHEIVASRLPALRGQFPISTTLVLRLFGLLHGTNNSDFATRSVDALLSQTRLYLGGPESEDSVRHHLRFSIEYLRRQRLLSATGEPINFAGLVSHLYFTENAVFAFHSLLKGGYFHRLCGRMESKPEETLLQLVHVLCHLFNRVPVKRTEELVEAVHRSSSMVFLPELPEEAKMLLMQHNNETLSIFKGYVSSYISHSLSDKPDRTLPFTHTTVGGKSESPMLGENAPRAIIRSPFVALSGFDDDFTSIHDLCSTVRGGVFLEESAIPYIPIWRVDPDAPELNAYIYDFYKHGSMNTLKHDNRIKGSDVWFYLKDFSLTLSTIVTGLEALIHGEDRPDDEDSMLKGPENEAEARALGAADVPPDAASDLPTVGSTETRKPNHDGTRKTPQHVNENWDDDDNDSDNDQGGSAHDGEAGNEDSPPPPRPPLHTKQQGDLLTVLRGFTSLRDDFDEKFRKVWA